MRAWKGLVAVLVAGLIAAACGGGDDDTDATTTTRPSTTTTTEPAGPADPVAAEAEVRANFGTYFDSNTPPDQAGALGQDFEEIRATLEQAAAAAPGGHRTIAVTKVTFTSETTADVTFDLLLDGTPLLPNFLGSAVFEDGTWKVSRAAQCDLAALGGFSCPEAAAEGS